MACRIEILVTLYMKTRLLIFLISIATMFGAAKAQNADYRLNVQNFCELTVVDGINVDYYCRPDSAGWVVFSCEPDIASRIMFDNKAEHLTVQTDADETPIQGVPLLRVYSASLRKIENSGDSAVRAFVEVPVQQFKARQIGNGSLEVHGLDAVIVDAGVTAGCGRLHLDGKADKTTIRNVGTGPIDASGLKSSEVRCFIFGTGDVDCRPKDKLRVFGAGSGIVYYHDKPTKITNRGIGVKALPGDGRTSYIAALDY